MMSEPFQRFESAIWFKCPKCHKQVSTVVEVPEPDWSSIESTYDMEGDANYDVSCPECTYLFDAAVSNYGGSVEVKLDGFPQTHVHADSPLFSPDSDYDDEPPDNPKDIFDEAFLQITKVLDEHGSYENGFDLINRMVFVQYISAFEAYLAETLVLKVAGDDEAIRRLLKSDKHLKELRLTLAEVLSEPEIVRQQVRNYLRAIVYHKIGRVHALYKGALEVEIKVRGDNGSLLNKAIEARHDCVHRNGFTRAGERNTVFLVPYIKKVADTLAAIVSDVEDQIYGQFPF